MDTQVGEGWSPSKAAAERRAKRQPSYLLRLDMWGLAGVMMALAMMFMPATPYHSPHGNVSLPTTNFATAQPGALREDVIKVIIKRDGNVYLGGGRVDPLDLQSDFREALHHGAEDKVYLAVDARAKYGDVKVVEDQIRAAGIQRICFLTEKAAK